jgi:hypothetical protein
MPLSRAWTASVLCRWLAGVNQRITPPLFYSVNFLQSIFLSSLIIYLYYTTGGVKCQGFINLSFGNRERNRTSPNRWIPSQYSFLPAGDLIEKISHPLPRRQGRLQKVSHFLLSSYIYYYTKSGSESQGFINLLFNNYLAPPFVLVLSAYVGLWPAS